MKKVKYKIGMCGNPLFPQVEWNDKQMEILKDIGFNMCQMNIAWDNRPAGEPLNLEHIEGDTELEFARREIVLKKYNMKGLPHFGIPRIKKLGHEANITPYITPACISDDITLKEECDKICSFFTKYTTVKDMMIYTYDQHAWLCSEFGMCPKCAGIPLNIRLSSFLNKIASSIYNIDKKIKLWWQPWELSLGQILKTIDGLDCSNIGLMLNTSGLESFFTNFDNSWIKNIGDKAKEKGIEIIGEIQATGSGVGTVPLQVFPCPTLVYRQISILDKLPTLVGIKEHFGINFDKIGANTLFLREFFRDPEASLDDLLDRTASRYGIVAKKHIINAWKYCEKGMDLIPYSFTYTYSNIACLSPKHDYNFPKVTCVHADTPAWESDRRTGFMLTHDMDYHPWALENAALLFEQSSRQFKLCADEYKMAMEICTDKHTELAEAYAEIIQMYRANMGQYLHFVEGLSAYDARIAAFQNDKKKFYDICARFREYLLMDIENCNEDEDVKKQLSEFDLDPYNYFDMHLRQDEHFFGETYVTKIDQRR